MSLLRPGTRRARPLVIGHRGAAAVAPENTLESLRAAVELGVDLVEFDVAPGLVLAHSERERPLNAVHLDEALSFLAPHGVGLHVDVKLSGYERDVVKALQVHEVEGRSIVSSTALRSLATFAQLAPQLTRAITYPHDRYGLTRVPWPAVAGRAGASALRAAMPVRVRRLVSHRAVSAVSLHWRLCSSEAVDAAHRAGAAVIAWTVNDGRAAEKLAAARVDGIVTDDPRVVMEALATLSPR